MDHDGKTFVLILSPILIVIGALFAVAFIKRRIEIYSDRIRVVRLFSNREMLFSQISGVTTFSGQHGQRFASLIPAEAGARKLTITLDMERRKEFEAWLTQTFTDLDKITYEKELDEIYHNPALQGTPEQKAARYKLARTCCNIANGIGVAVMLWGFVYPTPYKYVILILAVYPAVGLLLAICFRGIVRFGATKKSAYANVGVVCLVPALGLAVRAFFDWNVLDWNLFWMPFAEIAAGFFALNLLLGWSAVKGRGAIALLLIGSPLYGFGAAICLNGVLSTAPISRYEAQVVNMHADEGEYPEYYLTLAPWGPRTENADCRVSHDVYQYHQTGDTAHVALRTGKFGIPFYFAF